MFATPCIIPIPNPPGDAQPAVYWQAVAYSWQERWNRVAALRGIPGVRARVRFHNIYCSSAYAHLVARALGGR